MRSWGFQKTCSEPRTGSSANAKFATGEAHGRFGVGGTIQVLEYGEYCGVPEKMKVKRGVRPDTPIYRRRQTVQRYKTVKSTWRRVDDCCI